MQIPSWFKKLLASLGLVGGGVLAAGSSWMVYKQLGSPRISPIILAGYLGTLVGTASLVLSEDSLLK